MTEYSIKTKSQMAQALLADPILQETFEALKQRQIEVFLSGGSTEQVKEAQAIVSALNMIQGHLNSYITDEAFLDRQQKRKR